MNQGTITGRIRHRKTRWRVKAADAAARVLITLAGVGTILAVLLVCFFLASVVIPLFRPGSVNENRRIGAVVAPDGSAPLRLVADEYEVLGWAYFPDGAIKVLRLDNGKVLSSHKLFEDQAPTAQAFSLRGGHAVFGFDGGRVKFGAINFVTRFLEYADVEPRYRALPVGGVAESEDGVVQRIPTGQFRLQRLEVHFEEPLQLPTNSPVLLVDMSMQSYGPVLAAITSDGLLHINGIRRVRNIMTRQETLLPTGGSMEIDAIGERGPAKHLLLEGRADTALLVWEDGYALRIDARNRNEPVLAEAVRLIEGEGVSVTSIDFLIGKMTLAVGDSAGRVSTWFRIKPAYRPDETPPTVDASLLVKQQELPGGAAGSPVTALAASSRTRMLLAGFADGQVRLYHVTSSQLLAEAQVLEAGDAITALAFSPRDNGMFAGSRQALSNWSVRAPHPQITLSSIFTKVWYEGFDRPEHVWQSSSGSDEFEPKYGMVPLIFGALKATVYTMLFGVPIALLAAVFTSEFLHPKAKAKIKPVVEMMASLPSVVLGFLAALVFAPVIELVVPAILLSFFFVPLALLLAAFLWQLLPNTAATALARYRFLMMFVTLPAGLGVAFLLGPAVESLLFAGDIRGWLAWSFNPAKPEAGVQFRSAAGGWMILLLPASILAAALVMTLIVNPRIRRWGGARNRLQLALLNIVKFLAGAAITVGAALAASGLLSYAGFDPRGGYEIWGVDLSLMGTYIQRNALIVGFVMGFAVIPIIYTLAEDALSSVPDHLRAASLGAGATPWQTAIRIIIPTAMSGIFSAVMIGLGRAVGETMIVLMATGNTPVLEMNMFNGFRTLAANIAVELPEAVQNGTNYRMLFLAALTLFAMTFVVNTIAEVVRLRFRQRAFQL